MKFIPTVPADCLRPVLKPVPVLAAASRSVCRSGPRPLVFGPAGMPPLHDHVEKILFTEKDIQARVAELGRDLASMYQDKRPLVLGVLTGSFIFAADLVRNIQPVPSGLHVDFSRASSYAGKTTLSSGEVNVMMGKLPVQGRHVILVEDIVDTGNTTQKIMEDLRTAGAESCALVALLNKSSRRRADVAISMQGFECPDEFVVGYGLDFNEEYRSLPYVGVLKPQWYQ